MACRVISDNVNAAQSSYERTKRAIKCVVVFFSVFLFFNSYMITGKFNKWEKHPISELSFEYLFTSKYIKIENNARESKPLF
jgi:hypothetical protein